MVRWFENLHRDTKMKIIKLFNAKILAFVVMSMFFCFHAYADNTIVSAPDRNSFLAEASGSLWKVSENTGEAQRANIGYSMMPSLLVYGNGVYLGYIPMNPDLIKSSDGMNWKKFTPTIINAPANTSGGAMQNLMFVNGSFYAALAGGTLCSSSNGLTWNCSEKLPTNRSDTSQVMPCGNKIVSIIQTINSTPSGFMTEEAIGFSSNGKTWNNISVPYRVDNWSCAGNVIVGIKSSANIMNPKKIVTVISSGRVITSEPLNHIINNYLGSRNGKILAYGAFDDTVGISTDGGKTFKFQRAEKTSNILAMTCGKSACLSQAAAGGLDVVLLYSKDAINWHSVR